MAFASTSEVPVGRSQDEIRRTLTKYGATGFMFGQSNGQGIVAFEIHDRRVRFLVPLPKDAKSKKDLQLERTRWRCLLLAIKAKLECAESGISTFEKEFLSYILLPDGTTVGENVESHVAQVYNSGSMQPLLGPGVG